MLLMDTGQIITAKHSEPHIGLRAEMTISVMNRLGYDAMGLGMTDLSLGQDFLKQLAANATFPFVSSNLRSTRPGDNWFVPYTVTEQSGFRVAILSVLPQDALLQIPAALLMDNLSIEDPLSALPPLLDRLDAEVDVIILLSQLRYDDNTKLAEALPGIDVIATNPDDGVPYFLPDSPFLFVVEPKAEAMSIVHLRAGGQDTLIPAMELYNLGEEVAPDPATEALISRKYLDAWRERREDVLQRERRKVLELTPEEFFKRNDDLRLKTPPESGQ